jgi:putative DNA primase/helicase
LISQEDQSVVPEHVRRRFIQVGRNYYFPDGVRAFTDRGRRLTTPSENTEVIRSLVTIAQERGWKEITVRGTDAFRREAWFAARQLGLDVHGYRPTEVEQARLVRTIAAQAGKARPSRAPQVDRRGLQAKESTTGQPRATKELLTGRLIEHGRATYQQDPRQPMSYYAKLETERGVRVIWGVDLERAFKESITQPKVGDLVGLQSPRRESVKVQATAVSDDGRVVGQKDIETHRNRWVVEKQEFFEARRKAAAAVRDASASPSETVKENPELVGTYLQIRAAELAAKKIKDPKDRQRFVASVRTALADSVGRGEPLPRVKLRERVAAKIQPRTRGTRGQEQPPARG